MEQSARKSISSARVKQVAKSTPATQSPKTVKAKLAEKRANAEKLEVAAKSAAVPVGHSVVPQAAAAVAPAVEEEAEPSTEPSLKRRNTGIAMTAAARNMAICANKLIIFHPACSRA